MISTMRPVIIAMLAVSSLPGAAAFLPGSPSLASSRRNAATATVHPAGALALRCSVERRDHAFGGLFAAGIGALAMPARGAWAGEPAARKRTWGVRDVNGMFHGRPSLARMCAEGAADGEYVSWDDESENGEGANMFGDSPLHLAAEQGQVSAIEELLAEEAYTEATNLDGYTALHLAAYVGQEGAATALLAGGASANARDVDEWTPLHVSVANGHDGVVRTLLGAGADVDARNGGGETPLHLAADRGYVQVAQALLDAGAGKEVARDADGATPLHASVLYGRVAVMQLLLEAGANVEARTSPRGETPLHLAAEKGHEAGAKALLAAGADFNAKRGSDEATPLYIANLVEIPQMVKILEGCGAVSESSLTQDFEANEKGYIYNSGS